MKSDTQQWMEDEAEALLRRSGMLAGCPETGSGHHGELKHNGRCEFCSMDLHICTDQCDHPPSEELGQVLGRG